MDTMVTRFGEFPAAEQEPSLDADAATIDATRRNPSDASEPSSMRAVDPTATRDHDAARYQWRALLGRGGMGEVRLCHDERIGRDVAVKLMLSNASDAGGRARFLREARVQGQLEHPGIVPVHDLEVFHDGSAYFAMKRVRGRTLADILRALRGGDVDTLRDFPLRRLLGAFNSVCLAVQFAHEKSVVHRDIKPANIMVGDFGEVYLLDWGLAKALAHDDDEATVNASPTTVDAGATLAGSMLGTPGYMAPEQIDPSIGPIGPAADVYALGTVLFEILSLQRYVSAGDVLEATMVTLQGAERRPARRAPPNRAALIAPELDELCARALAREPAERVPSARALQDEIDRYLAGAHDRERRQAQARAHLQSALALPDDERGRSGALRELGSAVTLDPDNDDARRALLRLLTTAPREIPPAVRQRTRDDELAQRRYLGRARAVSLLPFASVAPLALWVGIREPFWFWFSSLMLLVVSPLLNLVAVSGREPRPWREAAGHLAFLLAVAGFARMAGPLVVLPGAVTAWAVQVQLDPRPRVRISVLVACVAAFVGWVVLEASGLIAPSYSFVEGGVLVHAHMLELSPLTLVVLTLVSVFTVVMPSFFAHRSRTALAAAEERLRLQAWQLEQMVPSDSARP